jgi:Ser/Thr protein kinase RdoA (MazF antagonist)
VSKAPAEPCPSLSAIAGNFRAQESITAIKPLGNGNVNDTFLVSLEGDEPDAFVMQRVNTRVFQTPELVMRNMLVLGDHIERKLNNDPPELNGRRWEMPRVMKLRHSNGHWVEDKGDFWRGISYIGAAVSMEVVNSAEQAREVGYGLGMFHHLISDLPVQQLADTLEGFHITPNYLRQYQSLIASRPSNDCCSQEQWCHSFISARQGFASVLEDAKARGDLQLRPIHGDPKVNNLMLDASTGQAIALVDLDTVKPGLVHYDIGDCLRSGCNPLGEESTEFEKIHFDRYRCEAILEGYLSVARRFLTPADHHHLFDAIRLIPFELGLRFFSDHLNGNTYFRTSHPRQNLERALVQFQLTASIESQEAELRSLLQRLR